MSNAQQIVKGTPGTLPGGTRRRVSVSKERLVAIESMFQEQPVPLVIRPTVDGLDLAAWGSENREQIQGHLRKAGAILFRGFPIDTVEQFERCAEAVAGSTMEYKERSSPRTQVGNRTYTSTDYQADQQIFPHNEHSYASTFPQVILFGCLLPAERGGETPMVDCRRVLARMDPAVRDAFERRGWMYVRNYGGGCGLTWESAFQTTDRDAVESYCRANRLEWEWRPGNTLRTRQVRPAIIAHPQSREPVWFNHAAFFHVSTLPKETADELVQQFAEEDLPNNTYYGDGGSIESAVLDHLRALYLEGKVMFPWRHGDLLMLDNILTAHARESYAGPRRIVVALAEPFIRTDL